MNIGTNVIHIKVTAQETSVVKDYFLFVVRAASQPSVVTLGALSTSASGVMLRATVTPNAVNASVWFEWGTDTSYGNIVGSNGVSGESVTPVNATLSGLTTGTIYHYRASVSNSVGVASTADRSFVTGSVIVTTLADSGEGSLRDAVTQSFAVAPVSFAISGTIVLTSGELNITAPVSISGPGAPNLAISGGHNSRIFTIGVSNSVTISDLTIRDGQAAIDLGGGGIYNLGNLRLKNCLVSSNRSGDGFGLFTTIHSAGIGGGIQNDGVMSVVGCTLAGNKAGNGGSVSGGFGYGYGGSGGYGGGIGNTGIMLVTNCTIAGNSCGTGGSGQPLVSGPFVVIPGGPGNDGGGGGIYNSGALTLAAVTICSNTCSANSFGGGGLAQDGSPPALDSTIVANNSAPKAPDVLGNFLPWAITWSARPMALLALPMA